jgi:multiple sugar transport system permease protein
MAQLAPAVKKSGSYRSSGRVWVHAALIIGAIFMLIPFLWMLSTSVKSFAESMQVPPVWLP